MEERERGIYTESSRGTEVGSVNGVVVNASCLDWMIRKNLCLDWCREGYSFFSSLFSFQNLCVSTLKKIAQGLGGKRRGTTLRVGDERKSSEMGVGNESLNFEISDGLVREKNRLI